MVMETTGARTALKGVQNGDVLAFHSDVASGLFPE